MYINLTHYVFLLGVVLILVAIFLRKDVILPSLIVIFILGVVSRKSVIGGFNTLYNSLVFSGEKFMMLIITIAIVTALSKMLCEIGSDYLIMKPITKLMKGPVITFWVLGITITITSLFFWPSPAVALLGTILLPAAIKSGLTPMVVAMVMSIFGFGIALSSDFIIQGAPTITGTAAGISPEDIISEGAPLFFTMSIVTSLSAFIILKKNGQLSNTNKKVEIDNSVENEGFKNKKLSLNSKIIAILTPLLFLLSVIFIYYNELRGNDATSLIMGVAITILIIGSINEFRINSFKKITIYFREGLLFGTRIFAPVIPIGAFFYLGGTDLTHLVGMDINDSGIISDWGTLLASSEQLNNIAVTFIYMVISGLTGLDGSGFSSLPFIGSLSLTISYALDINIVTLATLGQITAVWVGGGVILPWSVLTVSAVCDVDPIDLAKNNAVPVFIGYIATFIVACFML